MGIFGDPVPYWASLLKGHRGDPPHRLPDGDEIDWDGIIQPENPRDFDRAAIEAARIAGGSDGVDHEECNK